MPLPPIVIPPKTTHAKTSIAAQLTAMLKAHGPAWQNYSGFILKWAGVYKIDPLYVAAVLLTENAPADIGAKSTAGAIGPAQILDSSVNPNLNPNAIWDGPGVLTPEWKQNFNNAIKYVAWRMAGQINARGSLDAAYAGGYNTTAYTGRPPSALLPKGYTPTSGPGTQATPVETAGPSVAGTAARQALTSTSWAILRNGKVVFAATRDSYDPSTGQPIPNAPKGTLKVFGQPLTQGAFLQQYASITDDYLAYTGKRPSFAQAAQVIKAGTSQFQLRANLAKTPAFLLSPVWKQNAPGYEAVYKSVYGDTAHIDVAAVRYAVANNLGSEGFASKLRERPDYQTSQEFQQKTAQFTNVYSQIYGSADEQGHARIKTAAVAGWSPDQFAQFLRAQPEWKGSAEAQSLYYGLAQRLGLIPGAQTVLQNPPPAPAAPAVPEAPTNAGGA